MTQDILDRIEKNRVKVQNEALGKDTDVSNVTANTGSTGGSDDSGSDDDGGDPDPTNVIGSGYYQPNPQSDYQTDYKPSAPTGQSHLKQKNILAGEKDLDAHHLEGSSTKNQDAYI